MDRFIDCINPVNNRVEQDPSAEIYDDDVSKNFNDRRNSTTAVIDLPVGYEDEMTDHNITRCSIPQATSISNFLEHANNRINCSADTGRLAARRRIRRSLFHVWDNQLALKLFGTRERVLEEQERQEKIIHWVIHPCSKFRYQDYNYFCWFCKHFVHLSLLMLLQFLLFGWF